MTALRLILADQLSESIPSLAGLSEDDVVMLSEVMEEANYVPHHLKKIAFFIFGYVAFRKVAESARLACAIC